MPSQLALEQIRARAQRFKIVAVIVCIIAALGAVVAGYAISQPKAQGNDPKPRSLSASIWKVELDTKGALVATKEFPARSGDGSAPGLDTVAEWVSSQLELTARKSAPNVHLKVRIPADLKNQEPVIQRIPDGKMNVLLWDARGSGKSRTPLTRESLKQMQSVFQLEIRIPGSETTVIEVTPGTALVREMELAPGTVSIGVEKFTGLDDGVSASVCSQLSANPLIKVVSPDMLEAVRKEIEVKKEIIRNRPMEQMTVRSLGVDYIISGSIEAKMP